MSGVEAICRGLREWGIKMSPYDLDMGKAFDINSSAGLIFAIVLALRIEPGGLAWLVPLCSSWVWINRGTTGRSESFPLGRAWVHCVQYGNKMMVRTVILLWILQSRGHCIGLEQPVSSLMEFVPRFQAMIRRCQKQKGTN